VQVDPFGHLLEIRSSTTLISLRDLFVAIVPVSFQSGLLPLSLFLGPRLPHPTPETDKIVLRQQFAKLSLRILLPHPRPPHVFILKLSGRETKTGGDEGLVVDEGLDGCEGCLEEGTVREEEGMEGSETLGVKRREMVGKELTFEKWGQSGMLKTRITRQYG
jgi:hypothetical protein